MKNIKSTQTVSVLYATAAICLNQLCCWGGNVRHAGQQNWRPGVDYLWSTQLYELKDSTSVLFVLVTQQLNQLLFSDSMITLLIHGNQFK